MTQRKSMYTQIEKIGPKEAEAYLGKNFQWNRRIRPSVLARFTREMAEGNWHETAETVKITATGVLLDGQHRMKAIVDSGVTLPLLVAHNVNPDSFKYVDIGATRSFSDVMHTMGSTIQNQQVAIARIVEFGIQINGITLNRSPLELRALYQKHKKAVDLVYYGKGVPGITVAPVLAAVALASYYEQHEDIAEFVARLRDGTMQAKRDRNVILLREWSFANSTGAGGARVTIFLRAQRAVKAFCDGEVLGRLMIPRDEIYEAREGMD